LVGSFHLVAVPECWGAEHVFQPQDGHFGYIRFLFNHGGQGLRLADPTNTALAVGDLIWNSRAGSTVRSYAAAVSALQNNQSFPSRCDIVVQIGDGWCETIGGNVSNRNPGGSVTKSAWRLSHQGLLVDTRKPWIGVIKNSL